MPDDIAGAGAGAGAAPNQGQGPSAELNNEKENRIDDDESIDPNYAVSYRWLDEGVTHTDGRVYHGAVQLTTQGRTFQVRKGDAVLLFSDEDDWNVQWPCRVERMWESAQNSDDPRPPVLFTARWFWHKGDLKQLPYQWKGSLTKDQLVSRMAADEVVLSNHLDENELATIEGPCYMAYHAKSENRIRPTGSRTRLPKSFQCQYRVDITPGNTSVKLLSMTTEDKHFYARNLTEDQRQAIQDQRRALSEYEESRKPKVAWKPPLSETALHDFLSRLADLHTPYFSHHGQLTSQEPYCTPPIEIDRNAHLKECNIGAALELLHDHQYNAEILHVLVLLLESLSSVLPKNLTILS